MKYSTKEWIIYKIDNKLGLNAIWLKFYLIFMSFTLPVPEPGRGVSRMYIPPGKDETSMRRGPIRSVPVRIEKTILPVRLYILTFPFVPAGIPIFRVPVHAVGFRRAVIGIGPLAD